MHPKWKNDGFWLHRDGVPGHSDKTKVFLSVDPSDQEKADRIFTDFMDRKNLMGKKSGGKGRSAFIIYSDNISRENLIELEQELLNAKVKPRLLKSGEILPDRTIPGSIFMYYKYDGHAQGFYDTNEQVQYMDSLERKLSLPKTLNLYLNMNSIAGSVTIPDGYLPGPLDAPYREYLELIRNATAVQRQLIDILVFRTLLAEDNHEAIQWGRLKPDFIVENLQLIKNIVKATDQNDIPTNRTLLNKFLEGGTTTSEPTIKNSTFPIVMDLKKADEKDVEKILNSILGIEKEETIEEVSHMLDGISFDIDKFYGDFPPEEPVKKYKIDYRKKPPIYSRYWEVYHGIFDRLGIVGKESDGTLSKYATEESHKFAKNLRTFIEHLKIISPNDSSLDYALESIDLLIPKIKRGDSWLYVDEFEYDQKLRETIFVDILGKYIDNTFANLANDEYCSFIKNYSEALGDDILTDELKISIGARFEGIFHYGNINNYHILSAYRKRLKEIFSQINTAYREKSGIDFFREENHLALSKFCSATTLKEMQDAIYDKEFKAIKRYIARRMEREGGPISSEFSNDPPILFRGISDISDSVSRKIMEDGERGLSFLLDIKRNSREVLDSNHLHKNYLSFTSDFDVSSGRYSNNGSIFVLLPKPGHQYYCPIFHDHRTFMYSEMDLTSTETEDIFGYFKYAGYNKYKFVANPNFVPIPGDVRYSTLKNLKDGKVYSAVEVQKAINKNKNILRYKDAMVSKIVAETKNIANFFTSPDGGVAHLAHFVQHIKKYLDPIDIYPSMELDIRRQLEAISQKLRDRPDINNEGKMDLILNNCIITHYAVKANGKREIRTIKYLPYLYRFVKNNESYRTKCGVDKTGAIAMGSILSELEEAAKRIDEKKFAAEKAVLEQQRLRIHEESKTIEGIPIIEETSRSDPDEDDYEYEDLEIATIYKSKMSDWKPSEDQTTILYYDKTEEEERKRDEEFLSTAAPKTADTAPWELPRKSTVEFYGEAWNDDKDLSLSETAAVIEADEQKIYTTYGSSILEDFDDAVYLGKPSAIAEDFKSSEFIDLTDPSIHRPSFAIPKAQSTVKEMYCPLRADFQGLIGRKLQIQSIANYGILGSLANSFVSKLAAAALTQSARDISVKVQ